MSEKYTHFLDNSSKKSQKTRSFLGKLTNFHLFLFVSTSPIFQNPQSKSPHHPSPISLPPNCNICNPATQFSKINPENEPAGIFFTSFIFFSHPIKSDNLHKKLFIQTLSSFFISEKSWKKIYVWNEEKLHWKFVGGSLWSLADVVHSINEFFFVLFQLNLIACVSTFLYQFNFVIFFLTLFCNCQFPLF